MPHLANHAPLQHPPPDPLRLVHRRQPHLNNLDLTALLSPEEPHLNRASLPKSEGPYGNRDRPNSNVLRTSDSKLSEENDDNSEPRNDKLKHKGPRNRAIEIDSAMHKRWSVRELQMLRKLSSNGKPKLKELHKGVKLRKNGCVEALKLHNGEPLKVFSKRIQQRDAQLHRTKPYPDLLRPPHKLARPLANLWEF
jgi:hypothetical protein